MKKAKIENIGKIIEYGSPGVSRKMRLVKVKDEKGNELNALAWGDISKTLSKGGNVYIAKTPSPNPDVKFSNYLIIKNG